MEKYFSWISCNVGQPRCGWPTITKPFIFTTLRSRQHVSHTALFSRPVCVSVTTLLNRGQSNKQKDNNNKMMRCSYELYSTLKLYSVSNSSGDTVKPRTVASCRCVFYACILGVYAPCTTTHTHARTHARKHARTQTHTIYQL